MEEVQGVMWCVIREARFIYEAIGEDLLISVVLDQFCCTVVKHGNLLLQMSKVG